MAGRSWQIEGRYVEYCSCEHGCPCESMADPSYEEHRMITVLPEGWVFHEAESASGFAKGLGAVKFELSPAAQLAGSCRLEPERLAP